MHTRSALAVLLVVTLWADAGVLAQAPSQGAPAFTVEELMAHVTTLAAPEMQGRATGTPGNAKARAFVLEQFRAAGLEPLPGSTFELPFSFERRIPADGKTASVKMQGINLLGICRGRGAQDNGAMVLTAHYDHLGVRDASI
jgi:hypothetical protein